MNISRELGLTYEDQEFMLIGMGTNVPIWALPATTVAEYIGMVIISFCIAYFLRPSTGVLFERVENTKRFEG